MRRRTMSSLQRYFIIVGVLSILLTLSGPQGVMGPARLAFGAISLLLGGAFIVVGLRLQQWLRTRLPLVIAVVWTRIGFQWLAGLYFGLMTSWAQEGIGIFLVRPVMITVFGFFILQNVRRLAAEREAPVTLSAV